MVYFTAKNKKYEAQMYAFWGKGGIIADLVFSVKIITSKGSFWERVLGLETFALSKWARTNGFFNG